MTLTITQFKRIDFGDIMDVVWAWHSPGFCCGATFTERPTEKTDPTKNKMGIRVIPAIVGKEQLGTKVDVHHVRTKNGDITISIRHDGNIEDSEDEVEN